MKKEVLSQIDLSKDSSDEEIQKLIFETVFRHSKEEFLLLEDRKKLAKAVFNALRKLDFIQDLLEDDEISEIMINGPECIFVEKNGEITRLEKTFDSREKLEDMIHDQSRHQRFRPHRFPRVPRCHQV